MTDEERKASWQPREPASQGTVVSDAIMAADVSDAAAVASDAPAAAETPAAEAPARAVSFSAKQVRRARDMLAKLYALRRAKRFYPLEHPAVAQAVEDMAAVIKTYHEEGVDVPITFYEDELLLGEQLLAEDSVLFDQLIRDMTSIGAGNIVFERGLTSAELTRFATIIASDPETVIAAGGVGAMVESAALEHISISGVAVSREQEDVLDEDADRLARASYANALELMRELERLIRSSQVLNVARVKGTVRSLIENVLNNRYATLELTGLKSFDEYTFYHSVNVAILSLALGSMLTHDFRFLSTLGVGALLHDLGKMSIDINTLNKTGPLNSDEWATIRQHPVFGAEGAALTPGLDKAAVVIVLEHHMRYDLTGYPHRVPPRQQHLASRIVAVADAYDAMTSRRSYSVARRQDDAILTLVKNADSALDPALVRLFVNLMGLYPPRSVVLLSSGETGVVVAPNPHDVTAPRVRIIAAADGTMTEPRDIDLSNAEESEGRTIERCLDPAGLNVDVSDFL
ncbi:MAG: HD-GYP domain-containing protein [Actinomycetota bacterium]|nr:HD-GYP domain-containing protein [Actinomycetota bacterium]